jgi:anthranilate phosphoribosyltransferase
MTTTASTSVVELANGAIRSFEITPEEFGLKRAPPAELKGGDAAHNAAALTAVLDGAKNAYRDIALLNAAGALVVADKARDLSEGVSLAAKALDSGAARKTLAKLVEVSNA